MSKPNRNRPLNRGLVWLVLAALAPALCAQESTPAPEKSEPNSETIKLEKVTVTGSNIRRTETETVLPVTVFDQEDIELRAVNTPADFFELLPQAGQTVVNESSSLGADARGDVNSIALRGIGSGNTLILLNGRRLPPHSISQNDGGTPSLSVNVNVLPGAAINRIEILRDGASAIYGADAAAGVANTILKRNLTGFETKFRYGDTQKNDLMEIKGTLSGGYEFNAGNTNLTFVLAGYFRERLPTRKRGFSADGDQRFFAPPPWNGLVVAGVAPSTTNPDNDFDNSSTSSPFGNFRRGNINTVDNTFTGSRTTSSRGIVTTQPVPPSTTLTLSTTGLFFIVPVTEGGVGIKQATPVRDIGSRESDYYQNLNEFRTHYPYTERKNAYLSFDHNFKNRLSFFSDVVYYESFSQTVREPTAITDTTDNNIFIPAANFYNPFGDRFFHLTGLPNADGSPRLVGTPGDILIVNHTNQETGPRFIDVDTDMLRLVAGFRGRMFDTWEWESGLLYGESTTRDVEHNALRESKMREALARTGTDAYNPLGYTFKNVGGLIVVDQPYANPAGVLDFIRADFLRKGTTGLYSWDLKTSGDVYELPGGTIKAAVGGEYRSESYTDFRPPYAGENPLDDPNPFLPKPIATGKADNDFIALSPNFNVDTERSMYAAYLELSVPVVAAKNKIPFVRSLELQLAGRHEKFSDFGGATKPKAGVTWYPVPWLMARASYNESFRAPNLAQLFPGTLVRSVFGISDPYRFDVTGLTTDGSRNRISFRSGNANLRPELAETKTFGVVIDVPYVKGLSVAVDWWKMEQTDAFNIFGLSRILSDDRDLLRAATAAQVTAGKTIDQVVLQNATSYLGSPLSIRRDITAADIAAFAAYNVGRPVADQRAPVGEFLRGLDDYFNLSGRNLQGIDFAVTYRTPRTKLGRFTIKAEAAYLDQWEQQVLPGDPFDSDLWEDGIPRLRGNASVSWRAGGWSAGVFANYIGSFKDTSALVSSTAVRAAIGPQSYLSEDFRFIVKEWITYNFNLGYDFKKSGGWLAGTAVKVGVNNVFDEDPPLSDESRGFAVGIHNPRGRSWYAEVKRSW